MADSTIRMLADDLHLNPEQVRELFRLLEQKYSAPYILRYRKDLAANLTADDITVLRRKLHDFHNLENERKNILKKLQEQGVDDENLIQQIESAETFSELFDYYIPFRPRKRSRSRLAQSQGLAELARQIVEHELDHENLFEGAKEYVNPELEVHSVPEVIEGVCHIINDWIAEEKTHRDLQRKVIEKKGRVSSKKSGKWDRKKHEEFREFGNFSCKISDIHPYQMLCLMRGKRINAVRYQIEAPIEDMCLQAAELYLEDGENEFYEIDAVFHDFNKLPNDNELETLNGPQLLYWCIRKSIAQTLAPILCKEKEKELRKTAENHALNIVRRKARNKLLKRPVENAKILGIAPGFRTGCQLAALDENGNVIECKSVFPHTPKNQWDEAKAVISDMINDNELLYGCIGNNNACHETEHLISEVIAENCNEFSYTVLESKPAELYAKSSIARKEFGRVADKNYFTAIALGLQILDPLEQLIKTSLRNICMTPYLKEVDNNRLDEELYHIAEECVSDIGPDANSAPAQMLQYVPGLNRKAAEQMEKWKGEHGPFKNRRSVREVPEIDVEMWYKAAPFVRVENSDNPLDNTQIHPDHYRVATALLEQLDMKPEDLADEEKREELKNRKKEVNFAQVEDTFEMHYLYLIEMFNELIDPWPDPRQDQPSYFFKQDILSFDQIQPFQMLYGRVQKVVKFGAFVDIGVGEDGLVHISELSPDFVEDPCDIVFVGEQVPVWVVDVDPENKRIALSMISEESAKEAAKKRKELEEKEKNRKRAEQKQREARSKVPDAKLPASMQQAKSAAQNQSRRMQNIKEFSEKKGQTEISSDDKDLKDKKDKEHGKKSDQKGEKVESGDLLNRLQFAAIEKRGEDKS